jgi:hypothetical protein
MVRSVVLSVVLATIVAWLVSRLVLAYDQAFMLVEYGSTTKPCPSCGRECIGVRRRREPAAPWSNWHSECCNVSLGSCTGS